MTVYPKLIVMSYKGSAHIRFTAYLPCVLLGLEQNAEPGLHVAQALLLAQSGVEVRASLHADCTPFEYLPFGLLFLYPKRRFFRSQPIKLALVLL
jgi:hypothetical protein